MKKVVMLVALLMLVSSLSYAECGPCADLKSTDTTKACGARLCNGACNAVFGWTEIFFRPGKVACEGGNLVVGFFRGLGYALKRTVVGVVEVATFWTPGDSIVTVDGCPLCAYKK